VPGERCRAPPAAPARPCTQACPTTTSPRRSAARLAW
jgi:hypothetical protein